MTMAERSRRRLVWAGLGSTVLLVAVAEALGAHFGPGADWFLVFILLFPIVGAVIATRQRFDPDRQLVFNS